VKISYSPETQLLDTGGGICTALPLLGKERFLLVNGDIWTDFDFNQLLHCEEAVGEIIVVDNPLQHPEGDYGLSEAGWITPKSSTQSKTYTYAGIAMLDPALFEGYSMNVPFRLPELYDHAISQSHLKGRYYQGLWTDVGNLERLEALEKRLSGCIYTEN
jgi:MurNAc alpha-1-phosphate uridylyltransferase